MRHHNSLTLVLLFLLIPKLFGQEIDGNLLGTENHPSWSIFETTAFTRPMKALEDRGISFQYLAVNDLSKAPIGAPGDHDWFGRYSLDLSATVDGEKSMRWKGGTVLLHAKRHAQETGLVNVGVAQAYSNIDADPQTSLYEAWVQQILFADRLRIKAGRIDANTDFDVVSTAVDFLNSSMGYSPTIMEFPTYPTPQVGAEIAASLGRSFQISAGEFKTSSGDITLTEAAKAWSVGQDQNAGRASFGIWDLRGPLVRFNGDAIQRFLGFYGVLEQSIWKRSLPNSADKRQNLQTFLQLGTGNGHENPFVCHIGGGTALTAPIRRRAADAAGVAITWVRFASELKPGYDAPNELVVEAYYKLNLSRSLSLITDVQDFQYPGGVRAHTDSLIATPRLVVSF